MLKKLSTIAILSFLVGQAALAGSPATKFVNIDLNIQENETPTQVKLRIPLSLMKVMAPNFRDAIEQANEAASQEFDLYQAWTELRNAGPTEFIDINGQDADISVATTETDLRISVKDSNEGDLWISVPLSLVDSLFNEDGAFDADGLIEALETFEGGDMITIEGSEINGRVWVD